jgi:hypothetical protein
VKMRRESDPGQHPDLTLLSPEVGWCRLTPDSPRVHPRLNPSSPQVNRMFTPGSHQVSPRFTPGSPQVHPRFTPGSPQVHPRFTPGSSQVHPRFSRLSPEAEAQAALVAELMAEVGRCGLTLSKPVLKVPALSALETLSSYNAFTFCVQIQLRRYAQVVEEQCHYIARNLQREKVRPRAQP